jgi:arsenate reductase
MNDVVIYHNPRCSKSRAALEILRAGGVEPVVVEYLREPPDAARIAELLRLLGMEPRDLIRKGEKEYAALGLDAPGVGRQRLIEAMAAHPILIERPIVVRGDRAVVGRPPERVRELL